MRRNIPGLLCLAGTFGVMFSALVSNSGENTAADFRHFAYSPVAKAEKALEKGDCEGALDQFRIALTRAERNGRKNVAARIRNRIAAAGFSLYGESKECGWSFLEYYALTSDNFEISSSLIENWALAQGDGSSKFTYTIKKVNDPYTVWGSRFIRVPNYIYAVFYEFFPREDAERKSQRVSYVKGLCKTWRAPTMVRCPKGIRSTKIVVRGLKPGQRIFVETGKMKLDLERFTRGADGTLTSEYMYNRGSATIWQVVAQCPYGDELDFGLELVKEYETL